MTLWHLGICTPHFYDTLTPWPQWTVSQIQLQWQWETVSGGSTTHTQECSSTWMPCHDGAQASRRLKESLLRSQTARTVFHLSTAAPCLSSRHILRARVYSSVTAPLKCCIRSAALRDKTTAVAFETPMLVFATEALSGASSLQIATISISMRLKRQNWRRASTDGRAPGSRVEAPGPPPI